VIGGCWGDRTHDIRLV